jgi:hypothetical protein
MHVVTVPSMAQMVTRTFDDLRAAGHRGEIVYVTDQGARKFKRRVVRISATSIDLLVNDGSREWAAWDVARITQRRGRAGRGALVGLAFGAGFGAFLAFTDGNCQHYGYEGCGRDDAEAALFLAALFGGIGGGAGRDWVARPTPVLSTIAPLRPRALRHSAICMKHFRGVRHVRLEC